MRISKSYAAAALALVILTTPFEAQAGSTASVKLKGLYIEMIDLDPNDGRPPGIEGFGDLVVIANSESIQSIGTNSYSYDRKQIAPISWAGGSISTSKTKTSSLVNVLQGNPFDLHGSGAGFDISLVSTSLGQLADEYYHSAADVCILCGFSFGLLPNTTMRVTASGEVSVMADDVLYDRDNAWALLRIVGGSYGTPDMTSELYAEEMSLSSLHPGPNPQMIVEFSNTNSYIIGAHLSINGNGVALTRPVPESSTALMLSMGLAALYAFGIVRPRVTAPPKNLARDP